MISACASTHSEAYNKAVEYLSKNDYGNASWHFNEAGDYKDAKEQAVFCSYHAGLEQYYSYCSGKGGTYEAARNGWLYFGKCGDYEDTRRLRLELFSYLADCWFDGEHVGFDMYTSDSMTADELEFLLKRAIEYDSARADGYTAASAMFSLFCKVEFNENGDRLVNTPLPADASDNLKEMIYDYFVTYLSSDGHIAQAEDNESKVFLSLGGYKDSALWAARADAAYKYVSPDDYYAFNGIIGSEAQPKTVAIAISHDLTYRYRLDANQLRIASLGDIRSTGDFAKASYVLLIESKDIYQSSETYYWEMTANEHAVKFYDVEVSVALLSKERETLYKKIVSLKCSHPDKIIKDEIYASMDRGWYDSAMADVASLIK
jgi:hypothetical protein